MQNIKLIPIEQLYSHPNNPRKDIGDITELAESIKARGIMQNLTVVCGHTLTHEEWCELSKQYSESPNEELRVLMNRRKTDEGYTVIIGHRRMAAAKKAGLTELPCVIAEMDQREQIATMLLENIQRSDLTVYEQAQGFQMMFDLGCSVDEISKQSGFSTTTVKRRLKMMELDQRILKDVAARQLSLGDFDQLAQIEDVKARNKCLKEIGTANFKQNIEYQLKEQKKAKILPRVKDEIKKLHAKKLEYSETHGGKYDSIGSQVRYYNWDGASPLFEETSDKEMFYYLDESFGTVRLYVKSKSAKPARRSKEEIEKEKRIDDAWKRADQLTESFYKLRKQFIDSFSVTARNSAKVMRGAYISAILRAVTYVCYATEIYELSGTQDVPWQNGEKCMKTIERLDGKTELFAKVVYCTFGDNSGNGYVQGYRKRMPEYKGSAVVLNALYEWLVSLGYEMSDEEKALQDGTHELFGLKERQDENV